MNTRTIQKQFARIGVKFSAKSHDAVHHVGPYAGWRNRVHEPELRTKGQECVLVYEEGFLEQLVIEAADAPDADGVVMLSIAWFNARRVYLCRVLEGQVKTMAIPAEKRHPLAHYVREMEHSARRLSERKQSRAKRQRKCAALSYTAAAQRVALDADAYDAYLRLVAACRSEKFVQDGGHVIHAYGQVESNTYITALLRVAKHHRDWLNGPESWQSPSHNAAKAFHSLLEHLFARYPTPAFLESVWFREKENWIACYIDVARGVNIRQVRTLQFPLTKRMAHHMMQAPERFTMEEAIRWGQVHGLGGSARFYTNIAGTRIPGTDKCNPAGHAFWQTVMQWLLQHPMLSPRQYGPLIDFIRRQKHRDPTYKVVGRSPRAMIRAMRQWHRELYRYRRRDVPKVWDGHNLDWWWTQKERGEAVSDWRLVEITSAERLQSESRMMRHCVYSYAWECAKGAMAIFSLQENGKPVLTVEYVPKTRQIGEVRGACNRVPSPAEWEVIRRWAEAKRIG